MGHWACHFVFGFEMQPMPHFWSSQSNRHLKWPMMQDQKSLTCRWLSCSELGRECVPLDFGYKGGRWIRRGQWGTKVDILRLAVGYQNATINRKPRNTEPEIGTYMSSQTRKSLLVGWYGTKFSPPRCSRSGCWTVLQLNWTVFEVQTQTAGVSPGPIAHTRISQPQSRYTFKVPVVHLLSGMYHSNNGETTVLFRTMASDRRYGNRRRR